AVPLMRSAPFFRLAVRAGHQRSSSGSTTGQIRDFMLYLLPNRRESRAGGRAGPLKIDRKWQPKRAQIFGSCGIFCPARRGLLGRAKAFAEQAGLGVRGGVL